MQAIHAVDKKSKRMQQLIKAKIFTMHWLWHPQEAYKPLQNVWLFQEASIVVKLPNWRNKRPKLRVQESIGNVVDGSLQINLAMVVGGGLLTDQELQHIVASNDGLVVGS